jgi:hypothetical protein
LLTSRAAKLVFWAINQIKSNQNYGIRKIRFLSFSLSLFVCVSLSHSSSSLTLSVFLFLVLFGCVLTRALHTHSRHALVAFSTSLCLLRLNQVPFCCSSRASKLSASGRGRDCYTTDFTNFASDAQVKMRTLQVMRKSSFSSWSFLPPPPLQSSFCFLFFVIFLARAPCSCSVLVLLACR